VPILCLLIVHVPKVERCGDPNVPFFARLVFDLAFSRCWLPWQIREELRLTQHLISVVSPAAHDEVGLVKVGGERAVELLDSCNGLFATMVLCTVRFLERRVCCVPLRTWSVGVEFFGVGFHPLHGRMLSGGVIPGAPVDEGWGGREGRHDEIRLQYHSSVSASALGGVCFQQASGALGYGEFSSDSARWKCR
jgi:hypothetical protein